MFVCQQCFCFPLYLLFVVLSWAGYLDAYPNQQQTWTAVKETHLINTQTDIITACGSSISYKSVHKSTQRQKNWQRRSGTHHDNLLLHVYAWRGQTHFTDDVKDYPQVINSTSWVSTSATQMFIKYLTLQSNSCSLLNLANLILHKYWFKTIIVCLK